MTGSARETRAARRRALVQAEVAQLNGPAAGETLGERGTTKRAVSFGAGLHFVVRKVAPDAQLGADLPPRHVNLRRNDVLADRSAADRPVYDPDLPPAEDFAYAATRTASVGVSAQQVQVAAQSVRGPLPAAAELNAYNRAAPNAADRIIKMAEQQASHRQRLERAQVVATIRDQYLGLVLGFLVCIAGIVAGAYVAVNGAPLAGSALSFGALASLVGTFVYGSRK